MATIRQQSERPCRASGLTSCLLPCLVLGWLSTAAVQASDNVLIVTIDGLRWQEVFGGLDSTLANVEDGGLGSASDVDSLMDELWRDDSAERRLALLPFLWSLAESANGVLLGNPAKGSQVTVTNGRNFSYPGYNELLSGFADDRVSSNAKLPNRNVTVLEWLQKQPGFDDRVAAIGSWDVFPYILNIERSGLLVNAGWQEVDTNLLGPLDEGTETLNYLMARTTPEWAAVRFDSFTARVAHELIDKRRPRVLYLALGEPDDWAHAGRYDRYLRGAKLDDQLIRETWELLQSIDQYRDDTSLIVTTDHGRGSTGRDWTSHGADVVGAENAWVVLWCPDECGLPSEKASATLSQVAATAAAMLGLDYRASEPRAQESLLPVPAK